jgi:ketosteroid isomerase-like protein
LLLAPNFIERPLKPRFSGAFPCQAFTTSRQSPASPCEIWTSTGGLCGASCPNGGCEEIRLCHDQNDENQVLSMTRWTTRGAYEAYLEWRDGTGDTAMFREMLINDMEISYYDEVLVIEPGAQTSMQNESSVEAQKEVVRQFFLRNSAGGIPEAVSLFRDDATYWLPTTRETLGMDELPEALKFVQSRLAGPIRYEIGTMVFEPNKVAVQLEGFARPSRCNVQQSLSLLFRVRGRQNRASS